MAKKTEEGPIRKSFLITGGVAIAAAVIGFLVMNFVVGGGDEPIDTGPPAALSQGVTTSTPTPSPASATIRPGGRDPFTPADGVSVATPPPTPAPVAPSPAIVNNGNDPTPPPGEGTPPPT
jgi:hypothetical protein